MLRRPFLALAALLAIAILTLILSSRNRGRVADDIGPPGPLDFTQGGRTREELTTVANALLTSGVRAIRFDSASVTVSPDTAASTVSDGVVDILRQRHVTWTNIRRPESVIVFTILQHRKAYHYIYSPRPLGPPYTMSATLTEADFYEWRDFWRMTKVGSDTNPCVRNQITFEPTIIYPYLRASLGDSFLAAVSSLSDADRITPEQRQAIVRALNQHRLAGSGLIENKAITYTPGVDFGLQIGATRLGRSSWAVPLLDSLLSQRVIQFTADRSHLRVRPDLAVPDVNRVEWLQIGLMDFLYGNLLEKPDPGYDLDLGYGWYFRSE